MKRGVQRGIADLAPDTIAVSVGQVSAVDALDGGFLATVTLQPSGMEVQARVVWSGIRSAGGSFFPVEVDDEVIVLFPDGDPNRAVCLPGLTSSAAKVPSSFDNSKPIFVHPSGASFATSESATTQAIVTQDFLGALSGVLSELMSGVLAVGAGIPAGSAVVPPVTTTTQMITDLATKYRSAALVTE